LQQAGFNVKPLERLVQSDVTRNDKGMIEFTPVV
jgi:hypothetical protein